MAHGNDVRWPHPPAGIVDERFRDLSAYSEHLTQVDKIGYHGDYPPRLRVFSPYIAPGVVQGARLARESTLLDLRLSPEDADAIVPVRRDWAAAVRETHVVHALTTDTGIERSMRLTGQTPEVFFASIGSFVEDGVELKVLSGEWIDGSRHFATTVVDSGDDRPKWEGRAYVDHIVSGGADRGVFTTEIITDPERVQAEMERITDLGAAAVSWAEYVGSFGA